MNLIIASRSNILFGDNDFIPVDWLRATQNCKGDRVSCAIIAPDCAQYEIADLK